MRFSKIAPLAMLATMFVSSPVLAQEEEDTGPIEVSANVAMTTDYRFRGVSFSDEDIAIQGGFDLSHESGFYIGTWASSLEDSALYGNSEVDIYAGWSGDVAPNISIDAGVLYYIYPNGDDTVGDSDYVEPYASVTAALGPVEATVGAAYAPEQGTALASDNIYVYGGLGAGIPDTPISLSAQLGYSEGSLDYGSGGYMDWSLGASVSYDILTFGIAYVDTDLPSVAGQDGAAVFTLSASF